jgi:hypothetical protein
MTEDNRYAEVQAHVVEAGLALEPRFAEIADRWERWWRLEADRPLLIGTAPRTGNGSWTKPFDLIERPAEWLAASRTHMESTRFLDQTVPSIRVDFGPVLTGAFLGAELEFAMRENTSWQKPLEDPYAESLEIDAGNRWFTACMNLAREVARDAAGSYLVCLPDFSGATDILANLRGSQELLMDLYDRPADVGRALPKLVDAWEFAYDRFMAIATGAGAGTTSWLHAWSAIPYTVPTCDFNAMIGPDQFGEFCLPFLEEQGRRAGRCLFHLDGPDAARHAPALAASTIDAIQYTPGAGSTGAIPQIPMLRAIQEAGKPVLVIAEMAEVPELMASLDPHATAIFVEDIPDASAVDELERTVGVL